MPPVEPPEEVSSRLLPKLVELLDVMVMFVWFAFAIWDVAVEVDEAEPPSFVAVTVDFRYLPTSAVTKL